MKNITKACITTTIFADNPALIFINLAPESKIPNNNPDRIITIGLFPAKTETARPVKPTLPENPSYNFP